MKRKTNLFYNEGPDSKFLTFSNYTESLTGNFLSTDTKLYPSMFLCLYIPSLTNDDNKKEFISKYLVGYYENKLAFLRDYCISEDKKPEDVLLPLSYLLETIQKYIVEKNDSLDKELLRNDLYDSEETTDNYLFNENSNLLNNLITYIGDISEQDYNGTYTDTICIIDFVKYFNGSIELDSDQSTILEEYRVNDSSTLYGWKNDLEGVEVFGNIYPMFDDNNHKSYYTKSKINKINVIENSDLSELKFNIIIPLFDVTNINYKSSKYINENIVNINEDGINLQFGEDYKPTLKNVPLGIWFSKSIVELYKDTNTGFSQSWSLMISSQFKPFPYTKNMSTIANENTNSNAFPTFAMIMSKQNDIINGFNKMTNLFNEQKSEIDNIKATLSNKAYETNIDKLRKEFINFEYEMTNKFNAFKQEVQTFMDNLAWKATE